MEDADLGELQGRLATIVKEHGSHDKIVVRRHRDTGCFVYHWAGSRDPNILDDLLNDALNKELLRWEDERRAAAEKSV